MTEFVQMVKFPETWNIRSAAWRDRTPDAEEAATARLVIESAAIALAEPS